MGSHEIKIALAQLNPVVGDIEGNLEKARYVRRKASEMGADLVVFSELFLSGYPPEGLVQNRQFLMQGYKACETFALETVDGGPSVLIGLPFYEGGRCMNAVFYLEDGSIAAKSMKRYLSPDSITGDADFFSAGNDYGLLKIRGLSVALAVGDELFNENVVTKLVSHGADLIISPQASCYWRKRPDERKKAVSHIAQNHHIPVLFVNQVGGQDDLVFDGASFVAQIDGHCAPELPAFEDALFLTKWEKQQKGNWICLESQENKPLSDEQADYSAAVLGLRDYIRKSGMKGVVLGLSGGMDSALVAAIATDALGAQNVLAILLPSQFSSKGSVDDAQKLSANLGIRSEIIPIMPVVSSVEETLKGLFAGHARDVTEENIQARSRGMILMAISNKLRLLLLSTGNKSEGAVGYSTLYGDTCGGYNPVADIFKTNIYKLAEARNNWKPDIGLGPEGAVIPQAIFTKAPSAELRENQKDQDSLPPYDVLDDILTQFVEEKKSLDEIIASGHDANIVRKVLQLVYHAEFKRRQVPFGPKLTRISFRDRKYPVICRFIG